MNGRSSSLRASQQRFGRWWRRRREHQRLAHEPAYRRAGEQQFDVLLHFPDLPVNLYQVRQWYGPLEQLQARRSVAILCYEPVTAEIIRSETKLPVLLIRGPSDFNRLVAVQAPKLILYPNQNYINFGILGLDSCQHAFICHGESDKIYMASNWMKVFNYDLVAGPAARQRLGRRLFRYDVEARTIEIGRPQIDVKADGPDFPVDGRVTVLYAPTWEGGRSSMRYGSVGSHAEAIVSALLADPRFRVIYRPHPRTGIVLPEQKAANERTIAMLESAAAADPGAHHLFDTTPFGWQLHTADVMITDISAVAYDWLTTAKPLIITRPTEPSAVIDTSTFVADFDLLSAADAPRIGEVIDAIRSDPEQLAMMHRWSAHYYGDTSPGASMDRFLRAVEQMIGERDEWMHRHDSLVLLEADEELADPDSLSEQPVAATAEVAARSSVIAFRRRVRRVVGIRRVRRVVQMARRLRRYQVNVANSETLLATNRLRASDADSRTDFLINYPGSPNSVTGLLRWLPALQQLAEHASVSILVGDVTAYNAIRQNTDLPCYFGRGASEAEFVAQQLQTKVMLYVSQSRLNLREAGFHDMFHVFLGDPGRSRKYWVNNRLRLYDYVLAPNQESRRLASERLMAYDVDGNVRVVGEAPATAVQITGRRQRRHLLTSTSVVEGGVDPGLVITELLQIRDERDQVVDQRDRLMAEQGIVLLKGGQS